MNFTCSNEVINQMKSLFNIFFRMEVSFQYDWEKKLLLLLKQVESLMTDDLDLTQPFIYIYRQAFSNILRHNTSVFQFTIYKLCSNDK